MNNKIQIIIWAIFLLLLSALMTHNGDILWIMLPLILYVGLGILQSPVSEDIHFETELAINKPDLDESRKIEVNFRLKNLGDQTVQILLADEIQYLMKNIVGEMSQIACLRPGQETNLQYSFNAVRGKFVWKKITLVAFDPLSLLESKFEFPVDTVVQIQPQKNRYRPIQIRPQSTIHAPGSIPAHLAGSGINFWGVREFHPGDSLRSIDWRLSARYPHRFFTKEFEQEEIAEIGIILDARRKTEIQVGDNSLLEHSIGAAASLADMFLHQGHRLSLLIFGEKIKAVYPGCGKIQEKRILDGLSNIKIGNEKDSFVNLDFLPLKMFPSHAVLILISPLTGSDWSIFPRLRALGYQVLLISPNPIQFSFPVINGDPIQKMAIRSAKIERHLQLKKIAALKIAVVDWSVDQPLTPLIHQAFKPSHS